MFFENFDLFDDEQYIVIFGNDDGDSVPEFILARMRSGGGGGNRLFVRELAARPLELKPPPPPEPAELETKADKSLKKMAEATPFLLGGLLSYLAGSEIEEESPIAKTLLSKLATKLANQGFGKLL